MCTPAAALGTTLIGGAASAFGSYSQASAQQASADYSAGIAEMNATLAARAAKDAIERGRSDVSAIYRKGDQIMGKQKAGFAANNISLSFGSPLDVISDTAAFTEMDVKNRLVNAEREAIGYQTQGMNFSAQAAGLRMQSDYLDTAKYVAPASTLLSTGAKVADYWYRLS
jgi:hypothetical protein